MIISGYRLISTFNHQYGSERNAMDVNSLMRINAIFILIVGMGAFFFDAIAFK